jgi:hypothetical protein
MTLWVSRDDQTVAIHGNINLNVRIEGSRVMEYSITEEATHLRHFWGELGHALDEAEKPADAGDRADEGEF